MKCFDVDEGRLKKEGGALDLRRKAGISVEPTLVSAKLSK